MQAAYNRAIFLRQNFLQGMAFSEVELLQPVIYVYAGESPRAAGFYHAVLNATLIDVRTGYGIIADNDNGDGGLVESHYFNLSFPNPNVVGGTSNYGLFERSYSRPPPPPPGRRVVRVVNPPNATMCLVTRYPVLLAARITACGGAVIGRHDQAPGIFQLRVRDPFGVIWTIQTRNYHPAAQPQHHFPHPYPNLNLGNLADGDGGGNANGGGNVNGGGN